MHRIDSTCRRWAACFHCVFLLACEKQNDKEERENDRTGTKLENENESKTHSWLSSMRPVVSRRGTVLLIVTILAAAKPTIATITNINIDIDTVGQSDRGFMTAEGLFCWMQNRAQLEVKQRRYTSDIAITALADRQCREISTRWNRKNSCETQTKSKKSALNSSMLQWSQSRKRSDNTLWSQSKENTVDGWTQSRQQQRFQNKNNAVKRNWGNHAGTCSIRKEKLKTVFVITTRS